MRRSIILANRVNIGGAWISGSWTISTNKLAVEFWWRYDEFGYAGGLGKTQPVYLAPIYLYRVLDIRYVPGKFQLDVMYGSGYYEYILVDFEFSIPSGLHHYYFDYDADVGKARFYLDGELVSEKDCAKVSIYPVISFIGIGHACPCFYSYAYAQGLYGETAIWLRTLTQDEVRKRFNGEKVDTTGLWGWWKMNELSGNTIYDYSGNGNHLTVGCGWRVGLASSKQLASYRELVLAEYGYNDGVVLRFEGSLEDYAKVVSGLSGVIEGANYQYVKEGYWNSALMVLIPDTVVKVNPQGGLDSLANSDISVVGWFRKCGLNSELINFKRLGLPSVSVKSDGVSAWLYLGDTAVEVVGGGIMNIALVYDRANRIVSLYRDGVLKSSMNWSAVFNSSEWNYFLKGGCMWGVRVYNRVLSSDDIAKEMRLDRRLGAVKWYDINDR
jgi:hypothetical protein